MAAEVFATAAVVTFISVLRARHGSVVQNASPQAASEEMASPAHGTGSTINTATRVRDSLLYRSEGSMGVVLSVEGPGGTREVWKVAKVTAAAQAPSDTLTCHLPKYMAKSSGAPVSSSGTAFVRENAAIARDALGEGYVPAQHTRTLREAEARAILQAVAHAEEVGSRKHSWITKHPLASLCLGDQVLVCADAQAPPLGPEAHGQGLAHFVLEIKPKSVVLPSISSAVWGERVGSKLLHPLKSSASRFTMQQQTKVALGKVATASSFNPEDLASASRLRVQKAVSALTCTPQNSLQVHCLEGAEEAQAAAVLRDVLLQEQLMVNLAALQRFCPWEEDAMAALRTVPGLPTVADRIKARSELCLSSLASRDSVAPDLSAGDVETLYRWLARREGTFEVDMMHAFCVGKAFKDVSIILSAQQVPTTDESRPIAPRQVSGYLNSHEDVVSLMKKPECLASSSSRSPPTPVGLLSTSGSGGQPGSSWAYTLQVVDLDGKSVECIPYYYHLDAIICLVYLESLMLVSPPAMTAVLQAGCTTASGAVAPPP